MRVTCTPTVRLTSVASAHCRHCTAATPPADSLPPDHLTVCIYGLFSHLKNNKDINLNYIQRPSPYRAVNTVYLGYKNQSVNVVEGNNRCLFSDPNKTHNTLCGQNVELLRVKLGGTYSNHWALKG